MPLEISTSSLEEQLLLLTHLRSAVLEVLHADTYHPQDSSHSKHLLEEHFDFLLLPGLQSPQFIICALACASAGQRQSAVQQTHNCKIVKVCFDGISRVYSIDGYSILAGDGR